VTLSTATTQPNGFSVTNLLVALVFVLLFWLFQRWLRDRVSTRRRERWAEEDRREQESLGDEHTGDADHPVGPTSPDGTADPDDPTPR
jgi:hypothetical protein